MITRTLNPDTMETQSGFVICPANNRQVEINEFLTLGRDTCNQLIFDDEFISARHARIERKNGGFFLRDLQSRNGTRINGARVVEAWLSDGDRLQIGKTDLMFACQRENITAPILTSKNMAWHSQLERLPAIAQSPFPILLTGPSGTGKDLLAQAIHRFSSRKNGDFISVNCCALSESLVESELFGHVRGSFTGATGDRKGAFESARGGTLFLDEIGDLPLPLQPKLLRALENNQIRPVGSDRAVETNVRIIAATHHDLRKLVLEDRFRADLYFRLHVIQIHTPALCERMEDFDELLYLFARDLRVRFSHGAIRALKEHAWPGNIRELKNAVARAGAYWGLEEITADDVPQLLDPAPVTTKDDERRPSLIKKMELDIIKTRLIANRGNQRKTAADLGIPKSTLNDRIRAYGIDLDKLV